MSLALSLGLVLTGSSCQTPQPGAAPRPAAPELKPEAGAWAQLERDDYVRLVLKAQQIEPAALLPAAHPLSQRAQYWLDLIDQRLRSHEPGRWLAVPKPQAAVLTTGVANAFTAQVPSCLAVATRLTALGMGMVADAGFIGPVAEQGETVLGEVAPDECATAPLTHQGLAKFAAQSSPEPCSFSLAEDSSDLRPVLRLALPCAQLSSSLSGKTVATGIASVGVANWISLDASVFTLGMDEHEFVAVLAHQLGHYYTARSLSEHGGFFYQRQSSHPALLAKSPPALDRLGAAVLAASKRLEFSPFSDTDQGGFTTGLSDHFAELASEIQRDHLCAASTDCQAACDELVTLKALGPGVAQVDAAFIACANLVPLRPDPSRPLFSQPPLRTLAASVGKVEGVEAAAASHLPTVKTWGPLLSWLNTWLLASVKPDQDVLKEALAKDLGYFTAEQEVDRLSAEWLAMIGIDPAVATKRYLDVQVSESTPSHPDQALSSPDQPGCAALYARQWRDTLGAPVVIPIGDYGEAHHNSCYRAWTLDRAIKDYHYQASAPPPAVPLPAWGELVKTAAALAKTPI